MQVALTVGKVDAGVAVLLTQDKRLIEFPSILLPQSITSGSIVDIKVSQNFEAEQKAHAAFQSLQAQILNTYGLRAPSTPALRVRNATQTSIVLEWDPIQLATTTLRSLSLYRNGSKAGNIPRPMDMLSTKMSGLAVDTEYSFYLVLKTSGGTYTSNTLNVKTHAMNNLTGIRVTPGVLPPQLQESLETAVERIGAKIVDSVRIETTHFVCTEGRGREWEKANEMNIPIVRPEWVEGCEREGKIIGVRGYYLDADPKQRQIGSNPALVVSRPSTSTPTSPTPKAPSAQQPQANIPASPDAESEVSGEPGPELPPTPPPKQSDKDLPPRPTEDDDDEDDEDDDEEDDDEAEKQTPEPKGKEREVESEDEDEDEPSVDEKRQPKAAGTKEGSEMEDVAL